MNYTLTVPVLADAKRKVMIFSLNESQQESTPTELQGDISINNHTPSTLRLIKIRPKPTIISFTENQ